MMIKTSIKIYIVLFLMELKCTRRLAFRERQTKGGLFINNHGKIISSQELLPGPTINKPWSIASGFISLLLFFFPAIWSASYVIVWSSSANTKGKWLLPHGAIKYHQWNIEWGWKWGGDTMILFLAAPVSGYAQYLERTSAIYSRFTLDVKNCSFRM